MLSEIELCFSVTRFEVGRSAANPVRPVCIIGSAKQFTCPMNVMRFFEKTQMTSISISVPAFKRAGLGLCLPIVLFVGGCATTPLSDRGDARLAAMVTQTRVVADFGPALACMDRQLADYGVRDVRLAVENLDKEPSKSAVRATEVFIGAMSKMAATNAGRVGVAASPASADFLVRGSLSQAASGREISIDLFAARPASTVTAAAALATSRNTLLLKPSNQGFDASIDYKALGLKFVTNGLGADGQARATRNAVELAAIEIVGKLAKVPYWRCLDVVSDNVGVKAQIDDWQTEMNGGAPSAAIVYYQSSLVSLGVLSKFERGTLDEGTKSALRTYKKALGLTVDDAINAELFRAHITADRSRMMKDVAAMIAAESRERLGVRIQIVEPPPLKRGQFVNFDIAPNVPAYVYCFLQDEESNIFRLWSSAPTPRVAPDAPPEPIPMPRGLLKVDAKGRAMQMTCFTLRNDAAKSAAVSTPTGAQVLTGPNPLRIPAVKSMQEVLSVLQASGQEVASDSVTVRAN